LEKSLNLSNKNIAIMIAVILFACLISFSSFKKSNVTYENTPENVVKNQIQSLLNPVLGMENFRVEVTQIRQDFKIERQTIAVIVDEARQISPPELDQINTLLRAAIGYDAARGDMIRVMAMPFQKQNAGNSFLNFNRDNLILIFELFILASLIVLFIYNNRKKPTMLEPVPHFLPPKNERTLSDQVLEEPAKAAAVLRVWLNQTQSEQT
jgi:flagellar biosynthesis/type III secretory pathway M-ring protein FliF/YscJ